MSGSDWTFLLAVGATAITLLLNFILTKRTLSVRLVLFIFGIIALSGTVYRYFDDQQRNAPRHLSEKQIARVVSKLEPFPRQLFQMITYPKCDECSGTFVLVYNILDKAKWVREGPPVGIPIGAMQSILVNVSDKADSRTKKAAEALTSALNDEDIKTHLDNDTDDAAIVDIIIGIKP